MNNVKYDTIKLKVFLGVQLMEICSPLELHVLGSHVKIKLGGRTTILIDCCFIVTAGILCCSSNKCDGGCFLC